MKEWIEDPELTVEELEGQDIFSKSDNEFPISPK